MMATNSYLDTSNDGHHPTSTCLTAQATLTRPMTKTRQVTETAAASAMRLEGGRWAPQHPTTTENG